MRLVDPFACGKIPLDAYVSDALRWVVDQYRPAFQSTKWPIDQTLSAFQWVMTSVPPTIMIVILALIAWQMAGRRVAIAAVVALVFVGFIGVWPETMITLALLPHRSVFDNVSMGLELRGVDPAERRKVAAEKLELVGLDGWGDRYPDELSGGMKQRVGLARAMAADPEILLMDEPFSALDPLIRRQLQTQFIELSKIFHKTTIFITHDLDEAIRLGDRIAIMKNGRIVQVGTPEDIVTNPTDDYVADFVAGISRVELVTAQKIMRPLAELAPAARAGLGTAPRAQGGATLHELMNMACETDSPIVIMDGDREAGVINQRTLLRGILGGTTEVDRAA